MRENKSVASLPQSSHFNMPLFAVITVPLCTNIPRDYSPAWNELHVKVYLINIYYQPTGVVLLQGTSHVSYGYQGHSCYSGLLVTRSSCPVYFSSGIRVLAPFGGVPGTQTGGADSCHPAPQAAPDTEHLAKAPQLRGGRAGGLPPGVLAILVPAQTSEGKKMASQTLPSLPKGALYQTP